MIHDLMNKSVKDSWIPLIVSLLLFIVIVFLAKVIAMFIDGSYGFTILHIVRISLSWVFLSLVFVKSLMNERQTK